MLLENKVAVIYGAGGPIGGAVARAFAREGARVFLAGRTLATLDTVANEIRSHGGSASTIVVDALDEQAVDSCIDAVVEQAGSIDISFPAWASRSRCLTIPCLLIGNSRASCVAILGLLWASRVNNR